MKSTLSKLIFTIILSSLLFVSCGNGNEENDEAKKLLDHLIECSELFEPCKANCPPRPTKDQMDLYWSILTSFCNGFPPDESNPPSEYECHLFAANQVFGDQYYDMYCNDRCVREYYACIFGDQWEGLNLKKPENFKIN